MNLVETKPIKVFLVDDHKTVLWGLERLIESAAPLMTIVGMAANCAELFAKLLSTTPDIILLDLDLGGENSLDCMEKLTHHTSAQILVLTGSSDPAVRQRAVMRGARGVIHKQVAADVLLRAIERVHHGEIWLDHAALGRVVATLANGNAPHQEAGKADALTKKEREIVATIATERGAQNKVIADKLSMSEHTLRNRLTTIYSKLGVKGRMELYLYATGQLQSAAIN